MHPLRTLKALASSWWHDPQPVQACVIRGTGPVLPVGKPITMVVWNVQFGAGRTRLFFYDGGKASHVPNDERDVALAKIASFLKDTSPDLVLLQEVDRVADRTGRMDQHRWLIEQIQMPVSTSTWIHKCPFVPVPTHEPLGEVNLHLGTYSQYAINRARRIALPRLNESVVRQQFNLKRAVLHTELPLSDGRTLDLFNLHLSAFSRGDGTLPKQVKALTQLLKNTNNPFIVGGDFNALPPGDDPSRLGTHEALYERFSPLAELFRDYTPARSAQEAIAQGTWVGLNETTPDRTLDHIFGQKVKWLGAKVPFTDASDHLPLVVKFMIPPL